MVGSHNLFGPEHFVDDAVDDDEEGDAGDDGDDDCLDDGVGISR